MKIQNVKGGYDFLPKEQRIRDYINNILKKLLKNMDFIMLKHQYFVIMICLQINMMRITIY